MLKYGFYDFLSIVFENIEYLFFSFFFLFFACIGLFAIHGAMVYEILVFEENSPIFPGGIDYRFQCRISLDDAAWTDWLSRLSLDFVHDILFG